MHFILKWLSRPLSKNIPVTWLWILMIFFGVVLIFTVSAPSKFKSSDLVNVPKGASLDEVAYELANNNIVRYPFVLKAILFVGKADSKVDAGDYVFGGPLSVYRVAWRITRGIYGLEPTRVRLPEGATRVQMAEILSQSFEKFDSDRFLEITNNDEGYLFPDTYFFLPNVDAESVRDTLIDTFDTKIEELSSEFSSSTRSVKEIIIMASIIDREAHIEKDQHLISGVLWERINIGMALQVDASFVYLLGKGSSELTTEDLKTDSPYNTYTNRGLPPGPISNPGLEAIRAALNPTESDYLFYLSDDDGVTHYARTFEEHKTNKRLYLR